MKHLLASLACLLRGHRDSVILWAAYRDDPLLGRQRVLKEICPRCEHVFGVASVGEAG